MSLFKKEKMSASFLAPPPSISFYDYCPFKILEE